MATPTTICPVCFVRFPVAKLTSTSVACPKCAHKFAAPVSGEDEPPTAKRIEVAPEQAQSPRREKPRREREEKPARAKPVREDASLSRKHRQEEAEEVEEVESEEEETPRAKRTKKPRTGFRRKGDEEESDGDSPNSASPLVLYGVIGGVAALLTVLIAVIVYVATRPSEMPVVVGPNSATPNFPDPIPPIPGPEEAPEPEPGPFRPNPNPVRPPNGMQQPPFGGIPQPPNPPFGGMQPPPLEGVPPVRPLPKEKPKQKLNLPAPAPVAMKPAPLTADSTDVKLPGSVKDICVGGGGRFLCLYLADKKQIAVFDVCEAKIVKYLPVAADGALIAANMNKLLVVYPDNNLVTRYDFATFEKESTLKLPFDGKVKTICMGSASAGPLLVQYQQGNGALDNAPVSYLDPIKLTEFELPNGAGGRGHASVRDMMHFRASPDGTVFGVWATSHSPTGLGSTVLTEGTAKSYYEHDSVGSIVPGPDGTLYTGMGRYTSTLKKKGDKQTGFCLPAVSGDLYFVLSSEGDDRFGGMPGRESAKRNASIKMPGDERSLVTLKDLPGTPSDAWTSSGLTADKRYLLVPEAKAFVAVAEDKLVVRKFDVIASLEASGVDYLFVSSRPGGVKPGDRFEYQIDTKSKKGGVSYTLESGPEGLKVSPTGRVTWAVPRDYTSGESVIITVSDKSGQQTFHTFDLKEGPPAPVPVAALPPGAVEPPMPKQPPVAELPTPKVDPDQIVQPAAKLFPQPRTKLTAKTTLKLPEAADKVCLGGGGRFVILRLPQAKQLAIVDLCEGKVTKYLPIPEGTAIFAAGMSKLFVYSPAADVYQRWNLETLEKEATVKNPVGKTPTQLLMGYASDGPLCANADTGKQWGESGMTFFHPQTFKELKLTPEQGGRGFAGGLPESGTVIRVSGDGRVYGWHRTSTSPQGFDSLVITGKTGKRYSQHQTPWHVAPGADGTIFAGFGIFTPEQKPVDGKFVDTYPNPIRISATSAPWYVRVTYGKQFRPGRTDQTQDEIVISMLGNPLLELAITDHEGFEFPKDAPHPAHIGNGTPFHDLDRFVLNPHAGVLAILGNGDKKICLHPIDLKALLAKSGKDYLMVMSQPSAAKRGEKWDYSPEVWSKSGKVVLKVDSGPPGMKVNGASVTWDVPKNFSESSVPVILTVSDGDKQESFHTFDLPVKSTQ